MEQAFRNLEDQYADQLVTEVVQLLNLDEKEGVSLLLLGGGSLAFGTALYTASGASSLVYADCDAQELAKADETDILTRQVEFSDVEQVAALGKYDAIVVKGVLECADLDLDAFLASLWKSLKFDCNAVIVLRDSVKHLPLSASVVQNWEESVPNAATVEEAAHENYSVDIHNFEAPASVNQSTLNTIYEALHCEAELDTLSDAEVAIKDQLKLMQLTKIMS